MYQSASQSSSDLRHPVGLPAGEIPCDDVFSGLPDQPEVEPEVVEAGDHRAEDLAGDEEMTQVGLGILCVHESFSERIYGREVGAPLFVFQIDDPF